LYVGQTRIPIYQVEYEADPNPQFRASLLTVIWDDPQASRRTSVELSERYFAQCLNRVKAEESELVLQLRRYSNNSKISNLFVERHLGKSGTVSIPIIFRLLLTFFSGQGALSPK
jgi:hypothetical protein